MSTVYGDFIVFVVCCGKFVLKITCQTGCDETGWQLTRGKINTVFCIIGSTLRAEKLITFILCNSFMFN